MGIMLVNLRAAVLNFILMASVSPSSPMLSWCFLPSLLEFLGKCNDPRSHCRQLQMPIENGNVFVSLFLCLWQVKGRKAVLCSSFHTPWPACMMNLCFDFFLLLKTASNHQLV